MPQEEQMKVNYVTETAPGDVSWRARLEYTISLCHVQVQALLINPLSRQNAALGVT